MTPRMNVPGLPRPPRAPAAKRRVPLTNDDFRHGPYVASQPDVELVLQEDIVLNFQDPPTRESPHHLGFFAGLVIAASRVTVSLNGHSIVMHPNFRERQRFFSLISLDVTPFPIGIMRFSTPPVAPTDITVAGGTLGLTSHFCIHASTLEEGRVLIADCRLLDFEVGAISLSGASDVMVRNCVFGRAKPPVTSSDFVMLRDLAATAREHNASAESEQLLTIAETRRRHMTSSDAICRALVLSPVFNVNGIPDSFPRRISRCAVVDCTFDDLMAEPVEVVGAALTEGSDKPLKDLHGNLIALEDVRAGSIVSRLQAAYSEELPSAVRRVLLAGSTQRFYPVHGQDRRGHSLQGKSSLFVRVDGCSDVILRNLRGGTVRSHGSEAAAVGYMLNGCERVSLAHVHVQGTTVGSVCSDALSDARPQSGLLLRRCQHVDVDDYRYVSEEACGGSFRMTENVRMRRCVVGAPTTFLHCRHVAMDQ